MPDDRGPPAERADDRREVADVIGKMIVAAGPNPVGIAVTAPVERGRPIPGRREPRRHPVPDARVLEEAVEQQDDALALTPFDEMEPETVPADDEALAR
jgi:hypothetical protein